MRSRADAAAAAAHAGGAAPGVLGGEHSEQAVEEGRSADRRSVASIDLHVPDKQRRAGLHLHHPARWSTLFLWWVTHSLVGGVVRVVFEAELIAITHSARFSLGPNDVSWLLQSGTISCVAGKLVCGPVIAWLGAVRIGCLSLLLCGVSVMGVAFSSSDGRPLISVLTAWNLMRFFQTATWPATNQLLASWFTEHEQGQAWGIMSTASRIGIIWLTFTISVRDSWWGALPQGYDRGDTVQATFLVVGAVLVLWAALIFSCLRNEPPPHPAHPAYPAHQGPSVQAMRGGGKEKSSPFSSPAAAADVKVPLLEDDCQDQAGGQVAGVAYVATLLKTMSSPMFVCVLFAQSMATPIAEFQSQVPLLIQRDPLLSEHYLGHGLTLWHMGVLLSVLVCGRLFDRCSVLQRIPLIGGTCLSAACLFAFVSAFPSVHGRPLLVILFLLGATGAPSNYLIASTFISQHAPRSLMASLSALMDLAGYSVTFILLSHRKANSDQLEETLKWTGAAALICVLASSALYVLQHRALQGANGARVAMRVRF
eukprot:Tamp_10201.p1 GENE.Tamp_10201~~Tamp_10201.p1  ORF type:complete len:538 (-),score=66.67 Tamp_10201:344-1957(-)